MTISRGPTRASLTAAALAIALLAAAGAEARQLPGAVGPVPVVAAPASVLQANGASLDEAVARVKRQYGGRILSAETRRSGKREVHVIRVLTRDNKVKTVRINGRRLGNRG